MLLLVPSITLYEVFKVILRESGENAALQALAAMQTGLVVDLSPQLAIAAAKLSLQHALPMADSIILATAQRHGAVVWTQDAHFKDLPDVKYFPARWNQTPAAPWEKRGGALPLTGILILKIARGLLTACPVRDATSVQGGSPAVSRAPIGSGGSTRRPPSPW